MLKFDIITQNEYKAGSYPGYNFYTYLNKDGCNYAVFQNIPDYNYSTNKRDAVKYIAYPVNDFTILNIKYLHGKSCIDLTKIIPCSKKEFSLILSMLERADYTEANRAALFIHNYINKVVNDLIKAREKYAAGKTEYQKTQYKKYTSDIKKYISNNDLLKDFNIPSIEDPETTETVKLKKDYVFTIGMKQNDYVIRRYDGYSFTVSGFKFAAYKQYKNYVVVFAENGLKVCDAEKKNDIVSSTIAVMEKIKDLLKMQSEKLTDARKIFVKTWNENDIVIMSKNGIETGSYKPGKIIDKPETDAENKPVSEAVKKPVQKKKRAARTDAAGKQKKPLKAVQKPETEKKAVLKTDAEKPETEKPVQPDTEEKKPVQPETEKPVTEKPVQIDIKAFASRYYTIYQELYDAVNYTDIARDSMLAFDRLSANKTDPVFNYVLRIFLEYRKDFISSDREAAAFYIAYMQYLKAVTDAESEAKIKRSGLRKKAVTEARADAHTEAVHETSTEEKTEAVHDTEARTEAVTDADTEATIAAAFSRYDDFTDRLKYWYSKGLITFDELTKELVSWHEKNLHYEKMLHDLETEKTETEAVIAAGNRCSKRAVKKKIRRNTLHTIPVDAAARLKPVTVIETEKHGIYTIKEKSPCSLLHTVNNKCCFMECRKNSIGFIDTS